MPNEDLEFKIKVSGDPTAIKAHTAAVKESGAATAAHAAPTKDLGKAEAEQATQTEGLNVKKKDLIGNLKVLRHEMPELGRLMAVIRNPIVAVGVAVFYVVDAFKQYIAKVEEAAAAIEPFENITAQFGRFRTVAQESKTAAAEFARQLAHIAEEADTADTRFKSINDHLERQAKLQTELVKARGEAAKKEVELAAASGAISPVEATRRTAAIDAAMVRGERKIGASKDWQSHFALSGKISQLTSESALAAQGIPAAEAGVESAKMGVASAESLADKTLTFAPEEIKKLMEKRKKAKEKLTDIQSRNDRDMFPAARKQKIENLAKDVADIEQDIKSQQDDMDKANSIKERNKATIAAAEAPLKSLRDKQAQATKALQDAQRQKAEMEAGFRETGPLEAQTRAFTDRAALLGTGAKLASEGRTAAESFTSVNREIRSRREQGHDESDLIPKRNEALRSIHDIEALKAEMNRAIQGLGDTIIQSLNATKSQIQNVQ